MSQLKKYTPLYLLVFLVLIGMSTNAIAQISTDEYNARVMQYVQQYKAMAMTEQKRIGMPAAVILAQGILETEAGNSELATQANNHFGIKCKSDWKGATFNHTDDRPNECFRKYKSAYESYKDHSDYLKNTPRYAPLFRLSITDYAAWAYGLKNCGYATSNTYAQRLISFIEDFKLQQYTYQAMSKDEFYSATKVTGAGNTAASAPVQKPLAADTFAPQRDTIVKEKPNPKESPITQDKVADSLKAPIYTNRNTFDSSKRHTVQTIEVDTVYQAPANISTSSSAGPLAANASKAKEENHITTYHGLKAVYMHKGDMLLSFAIKNNIRYAKLLEMNDLQDAPLPCDMYIFLEKKGSSGFHPMHKVLANETLLQIAQSEGIQMKHLLALNHLQPGQQVPEGTQLNLQQEAGLKLPLLNGNKNAPASSNTTLKPSNYSTNTIRHTPVDTGGSIATGNKIKVAPIAVPIAAKQPPAPQATVAASTPIAAPAASTLTKSATDADAIHTGKNSKIKASIIEDTLQKPTEKSSANVPTAEEEKLARLKAKLDKVVYAPVTNPATKSANEAETPVATPLAKASSQAAGAKSNKNTEDPAKFYTVKEGDTLFGIARRFNISIHQLNTLNNLDMDAGIKKGMKLRIKE